MRYQLIGLIHHGDHSEVPSPDLQRRFGQGGPLRESAVVAGWKIHTHPEHDHAPQGGQQVVLQARANIAEPSLAVWHRCEASHLSI